MPIQQLPLVLWIFKNTVKALLSLWGTYSILYTPEGDLKERGLIRDGGLFTNQMSRIYEAAKTAIPFFYPIFCEFNIQFSESRTKIQHSLIPNHMKINMQACLAKWMENV